MICDFCDIIVAGMDETFTRAYAKRLSDRVIYKESGFVLTPTIGQLHPTHLLVIPSKHVLGFLPGHLDVLERASAAIRGLGLAGGMFFEHGTARASLHANCGILHAHAHFVGLAKEEFVAEFRRATGAFPMGRDAVLAFSKENDEYLYLTDDFSTFTVAQQNLESQLVRKIIASRIGVEWDWRKYRAQDSVVELIDGKSSGNLEWAQRRSPT